MISLELYTSILNSLMMYWEFRLGLEIFSGILLVLIALLVVLSCLHTLYFAGHKTLLYRRKAPVEGWNKQFILATICLLLVISIMLVGIQIILQK